MATDAERRRLRALGVMERVKGFETDRQARQTAEIRDRMRKLVAEKQSLLHRITTESHVESTEGAAYLGRFIRSIRAEIERVDTLIHMLKPDLERAEEALRNALAEQKTFEILRISRTAALRDAARKREAAELDEIALQTWRR
ncbi:flagellar FliJ family protein [Pseudooceanicola sp. LIPI14-2-Ac024]|uniref:flagellar FliJ family protein n=1 Tax=Pseudooceanicola sp. LIPI14-2-Ac024 TaxID=3344875 RepID=UPI0035CF1039